MARWGVCCVIPASFKYAAPGSVLEAIDLLRTNEDAKVLAGGHSLLPLMKLRLANPPVLVDINRIPGLDYIREDPAMGRLRVGALVRHIEFERSELIHRRYPMLAETAGGIGDPLVRNRGTMAGAVAHADPAADWPAALLALDADVVATGSAGERVIPLRELYIAILTTSLRSDELLTEIRIPMPATRSGGAYEKLERKVGDYAVIGVGAYVTLDESGRVVQAGIGLCNAGSTSIKATAAEAFLLGKPAAADNINEAARLAMEASDPVEDDRGPVDYKRAMVRELTRRALRRAFDRAEGGTPR
ncbi:MAG TPA: xanthine dehydrogenase family protein subunit M [Chloroflexota bacterium]|nr:xanthine dehydrogenase family protein subunit M [Chloroflexota bacterium]